jgi:tRNA(Ile)-lysidine synthase TilS/MesJ
MNKRISYIISELIDQYQEDDRYNRPWIIGFSGGKDSTVLPYAEELYPDLGNIAVHRKKFGF